jgi:hypothetical protein
MPCIVLYKSVSIHILSDTELAPQEVTLMHTINAEIHAKMNGLFQDSILQLLLEKSHLTRIQAETLFIDALTNDLAEKIMNTDEKAKLRSENRGLSRGAFNRTLNQAKSNIKRSIFTILLLNYVGLLPSRELVFFEEATHKLREYFDAYKGLSNTENKSSESYRTLRILRSELEDFLAKMIDT